MCATYKYAIFATVNVNDFLQDWLLNNWTKYDYEELGLLNLNLNYYDQKAEASLYSVQLDRKLERFIRGSKVTCINKQKNCFSERKPEQNNYQIVEAASLQQKS